MRKGRESNPQTREGHPVSNRAASPIAAFPYVYPLGLEPRPTSLRGWHASNYARGTLCGERGIRTHRPLRAYLLSKQAPHQFGCSPRCGSCDVAHVEPTEFDPVQPQVRNHKRKGWDSNPQQPFDCYLLSGQAPDPAGSLPWPAREESNLHSQFRKLALFPLNYERIIEYLRQAGHPDLPRTLVRCSPSHSGHCSLNHRVLPDTFFKRHGASVLNGAPGRSRTDSLIVTNDALFLLSFGGKKARESRIGPTTFSPALPDRLRPGLDGWIRTSGLCLRRAALFPAELHRDGTR